MEGRLNAGMTDLLAASASLTAERMAAKLEKVAASGSILVSDMSATVAAGRDKVSDVFSRYLFLLGKLYFVTHFFHDAIFSSSFFSSYLVNSM